MSLFQILLIVGAIGRAGAAVVDATEVAAQHVSPLEKVTSIIQKIRSEVLKEEADEESIYDNFACFCKDKNGRLETMVNHHADLIGLTSSNIADWTARNNELGSREERRQDEYEEMHTEKANEKRRLAEEKTRWENAVAEYENNKRLITQAIKSLKDSKARVGSNALLQDAEVPGIAEYIAMADSMGLITAPKQKALASALLQGKNKGNPMESYGYHGGSNDIIELVESLMATQADIQKEQASEHAKAMDSMSNMIQVLKSKIQRSEREAIEIKYSRARLSKESAQARKTLVEERQDLDETEQVLKEVTTACQTRADEYDTRTAMRKDELAALTTALACLSNAKSAADKQARALLQAEVELRAKPKSLPKANHSAKETKAKVVKKESVAKKPPSFLQDLLEKSEHKAALRGRSDLSLDDLKKRKALAVILEEGLRVKSVMLTALAQKSENDPFAKVKQLLSDLSSRLEQEAGQEMNKKVWCDEELAKARGERDIRQQQAHSIDSELSNLAARADALKESIKYHSDQAIEIGSDIKDVYEHFFGVTKENRAALHEQKEARDEIKEALTILKTFYSQASKVADRERTLLQVADGSNPNSMAYRKERKVISREAKERKEAEEVRDEDRKKRERKRIGDLEGDVPAMQRQGSLGDAVALLETVASDFDRQINFLEGNYDEEQQRMVHMNEKLKSQKLHAEVLRDGDMQDLKSNKVVQVAKLDDLKTAQNLLDDALKELDGLKPTCIDTGMSYTERVKMREVEMKALNKALCILGENEKKYGCAP